jgi:hypothetical protein
MNKGPMIGGIVCLAVAAVLAVTSWRLPPEKLMFMAGGINVPMVILAVVGLVLLVAAKRR